MKMQNNISTQALIDRMTQDITNNQKKQLPKPRYFIVQSLSILLIYMLVLQWLLGMRSDILFKLQELTFVLEIFLLTCILISSVCVAIFNMYPDVYQKPHSTQAPYFFTFAFVLLILFELFMQKIAPHALNPLINLYLPKLQHSTHSIECLVFIISSACLPFLILWSLLKKGASIYGKRLGFLLALVAFSLGCLNLRLSEVTNDMAHLVLWHYFPALLISILSTIFGRLLFKW